MSGTRSTDRLQRRFVLHALALGAIVGAAACSKQPDSNASPAPAPPPAPPPPSANAHAMAPDDNLEGSDPSGALLNRIGTSIVAAAPAADGSDAAARDAAADHLAQLDVLFDAAEEHVLWGEYSSGKGADPESYKLTELPPLVWAKLYLSLFSFPGKFEVKHDGEFMTLELTARFRAALPAADYPHAIWNTSTEWESYAGTTGICMAFYRDHFVAAYRRVNAALAPAVATPDWDGRWTWADDNGAPQPRSAQFAYLFSPGNPHVASLEAAYRKLEPALTAQGCLNCHVPSNPGAADTLLLLCLPNQSLAARQAIPAVLRENSMPPADESKGAEAGIADDQTREDFIKLADEFQKWAEEALAYESQQRKGSPPGN